MRNSLAGNFTLVFPEDYGWYHRLYCEARVRIRGVYDKVTENKMTRNESEKLEVVIKYYERNMACKRRAHVHKAREKRVSENTIRSPMIFRFIYLFYFKDLLQFVTSRVIFLGLTMLLHNISVWIL